MSKHKGKNNKRNQYRNRVKNKETKIVKHHTKQEQLNKYYTTYYSLLVGNYLFKNNIPLNNLTSVKQIILIAKQYCNVKSIDNNLDFLTNFINANNIQLNIKDADNFLAIGHTSTNMINSFGLFKRFA